MIQPVATGAAHTAVADGQDASSASTASLSPEAAASQKAVASGSPVEVTDDRTEYTTTYANPDGTTFTLDQSTVPVRVHQRDGSWVSPDPTLEIRSDGTVGPKAAVVDLAFSGGGDGSGLVDIARGGKSLRLGWPGALPKPTLDGASAVYTDVLPGVDLRMTATAEGFRELLVVKSPQAAADPELKKVAFSLQADGLTVAPTSGGGMTAVDDDARPVFAAPAALMWDSQGDTAASGASAQLERTAAITQASSPSPSATTDPSAGTSADGTAGPGDGDASAVLPVQVSTDSLAVVPDAGMLANSDSNAYPLYIDPSVGLDQTAHTYLRSDGVSDFNWGNGSNNEGKGTGHCSSWNGYYCGPGYTERLYFQFSPSSLAGKKVLSATFRATESWSFTCDARWVDLERTSNISSSTTWSTRPSYLGMMASRDVSAGRSSLCDPSQPPAPIEFSGPSLTSAVGDLAAGKFSRLTLLLKARDETDTSAWKRFRNDAVLSVTYVGLPAVPTRAGIVEGSGISCETNSGDPDTITDPTPSLTAAVWTATGGGSGASLRAHFYIQKQTTDGWSVATEPVRPTSGYVGNGGVVTYPSPITLSEGVLYRLAVFSRSYYNGGDDYLESHSTVTTKDWCYFKVDTTAPKAPTVSFGQPYSECTANLCDPAGGPGTPGQFTFSPASGETDTAYEYKLASSASWSKPISGNKVNVAITPQVAGSEQLQVRAQDSAGRWGAKTVVKFNVAAGQTAIGRWHFDDAAPGSGVTTAADMATEGSTRHPATLYTSGAGWSSLARRGDGDRSLWLNDTSDTTRQAGYAATAAPVVNTQSSFTVSAWAYLTDESDFRTVLSETGSDGSGFSLYYSPNVQRWVFLWNWYENGVRKYLGASADTAGVPMKVWTHLTAVYNSKDRTISLYVNGRLQGSPVALPATSDATISDGTLQFGRASFTPGSYVNYWRGRIDEVAVWQRNLTEEEDGIATEDQLLDSNGVPSVELMGAWNPDGASGSTLADTTSGYGRTLTLSGGASLDGQALVLNGSDGAATAPGPLLDDTASFTATSLVDIDSSALLSKPTGYTAQVLGQRSADGSAWGFWYQLTGTDTDPDTDTTIPVGKWYFGQLNTDGSFDGVVSDEAAELGSPVRMTGTYDAPSGTIHFYLGPDENGAEATHPYTAVAGSGVFAAGEGYVGGSWGHYLPGKITDIRIWAGAMANQQITDTIGD
ncbi:LamG-like jellyroll fold domain-containing protein [Streptomyces sp. R39]|uniref:LamG-like jellyroll fold domain-containing protein n=1 Tax=Streptomyces sp. R39 TaxID=3238631 RepID=A0AB39QJ41_9ACTN